MMNIKKMLLLVCLFPTASVCSSEKKLDFYSTRIDGENVVYSYPLSKVEKLPIWDMKGETPIAFDRAMKKAWEYAKLKYPNVNLVLKEVKLDARGYPTNVPADQKKICWRYDFEFMNQTTWKEMPHKIIILMDGTILEPKPEAE